GDREVVERGRVDGEAGRDAGGVAAVGAAGHDEAEDEARACLVCRDRVANKRDVGARPGLGQACRDGLVRADVDLDVEGVPADWVRPAVPLVYDLTSTLPLMAFGAALSRLLKLS